MHEPSPPDSLTSNGFSDIVVELVRVTHNRPFQMFWDWYKETWRELHNVEFDPLNNEHINACIDVLERRALPTPLEVLNLEVRITGLSRVALAQITRGRVGHCYTVQSQMPQCVDHRVTVPLNIIKHPKFEARVRQLQRDAAALYDEMFEVGIPPQDCRYITLHGQQTTMMWNASFAALLGWFTMRCENGLTDELNIVGRMLRRRLIEQFCHQSPSGDIVDAVTGSGWSRLISKLDCLGAAAGKCHNRDKVFGNTGRYPSSSPDIPSIVNDAHPSDFDFEESAFYEELLTMDDSLLFPDERKMIEDWKKIGFRGRLIALESHR